MLVSGRIPYQREPKEYKYHLDKGIQTSCTFSIEKEKFEGPHDSHILKMARWIHKEVQFYDW